MGDQHSTEDLDCMVGNDPVPTCFSCRTLASLAGLMYVNLICAGVLFLEVIMIYAVLRRWRAVRWLGGMTLVLFLSALALVVFLFATYWATVPFPHFPPGWFDGRVPAALLGQSTLIVVFATVLNLLLSVFIVSTAPPPPPPDGPPPRSTSLPPPN